MTVRRSRAVAVRLRRRVLEARRYRREGDALRVRDIALWRGPGGSLSGGVRRRGGRPPGCAAAAAEAGQWARRYTAVAAAAKVAIHLVEARREPGPNEGARREKAEEKERRRTERKLARESQAPASSSMSWSAKSAALIPPGTGREGPGA
jgi:hypothetical protein